MSPPDDPGTDPSGPGQAGETADEEVHSQLVEALVLLLVEKGVLTKNDALSIVQSVAEVQQGRAIEGREPVAQTQAAIHLLRRMYGSFDALADRSEAALAGARNVHQLRPPIYDGRPEFPRDD